MVLTVVPVQIENVSLDKTGVSPRLRATLRNATSQPVTEVLQIYLGFPTQAGEPPQRLAAFGKVTVPARSRREVDLEIPAAAFEVWDESVRRWRAVTGEFEVMLGRSSRDIVHRARLSRVGQ